jgi:hypothetical protein
MTTADEAGYMASTWRFEHGRKAVLCALVGSYLSWYLPSSLHIMTSQKTVILKFITVGKLNPVL